MSYKYNFPKIKFVETNSIDEQLEHFLSEVEELKKESVRSDAFYTEAMDCAHSLETLFRILEKDAPHSTCRLKQSIIKKNIVRGYYPDVTDADAETASIKGGTDETLYRNKSYQRKANDKA